MDDDGYLCYLPASLCIMGLAHQLNKAAKLRAKSILPRVNRLDGASNAWPFEVPIQGSPQVFRMDAGGRDRPPPRDGRDGRDTRGGRGFQPRPFTPGGRNGGSRPPPADHPRGCFVRPDRNGRKWDPDLICDACRRSGHTASQCDMLAIAIFIEKYKKEASADMCVSCLSTGKSRPFDILRTIESCASYLPHLTSLMHGIFSNWYWCLD